MKDELDYNEYYQKAKEFWRREKWNVSLEPKIFDMIFYKTCEQYKNHFAITKDFCYFVDFFEKEVEYYLELLFYSKFNSSVYKNKKYPEVFKAMCMGKIVQYEQSRGVWVDYIKRPCSVKSYNINEELSWRVKEEVRT